MKRLLLFLIALATLRAQPQYINLASTPQSLSWTAPTATVTNFRQEFRVSGITAPGSDFRLYDDGAIAAYIASGTLNIKILSHTDSQYVTAANTNTDVRVRVTRNPTAHTISVEVWPASGAVSGYTFNQCSPVSSSSCSPSGSFTYGGSAVIGGSGLTQIAFWRAYSTIVPLYSLPPAEDPSSPGDLGDFEFQGSLADTSGRSLTLTLNTGSASYANNATFAPAANFRAYVTPPPIFYAAMDPTFRATQSITLDGSFAFDSLFDAGTPALFWQQLKGPSTGTFSSRTAARPLFSADLAGTYTIQLTATDSSRASGTTTLLVGAVATDANNVVITAQGSLWDKIMGAVTLNGTSPWPYYDLAETDVAQVDVAYGLSNDLPALGAQIDSGTGCTVSISNNPFIVTGNGNCHFTTDGLTVGNNCSDGSRSCFIIGWTTVDGAGTGRLYCGVLTITNDNDIVCGAYSGASSVVLGSGFPIYFIGANNGQGDAWVCSGDSANAACIPYYDVAAGLYRKYFRTGISTYLTWARSYADTWWPWGFDHGGATPFPRTENIISQTLRALDGHPERFGGVSGGGPGSAGIYASMYWWVVQDPFFPPGSDNREAGALQTYLGVLAVADPDATRHAQYCSWLHTSTPTWTSAVSASGYVGENIFGGSAPAYPYLKVSSAAPSAAPWRSMVFAPWGMAYSYLAESNASDSTCYNATQASAALASVASQATAGYTYGVSSTNGGPFYNINSLSNGNAGPGEGGYSGSGTVSAMLGSNQIVGLGSAFTSQTDLCGGGNYIGIAGSQYMASGGVNNTVYEVTGCTDDTHLTIAANWGTQGETVSPSEVQWSSAPPSSTSCGSGLATTCYTDAGSTPDGDVNLARTMAAIQGWAYQNASCSACLTYGDKLFGTAFGGPQDGPGGMLPCVGPYCTGNQTDFTGTLPGCNVSSPPCGMEGITPINGKNFGEGVGYPASATYLAARLGGPQAVQARTIPVMLTPPTNAVSAVITATTPAGIRTVTTCSVTASILNICDITGGDARQSAVNLQVTYKKSGGSVVATGDPYTITIQ